MFVFPLIFLAASNCDLTDKNFQIVEMNGTIIIRKKAENNNKQLIDLYK